MSLLSPTVSGLTPAAFWRWGRLLLGAGLGLGLLLVAYLTWSAPGVLLFFPLLLVGGVAAWYLFRQPLLNLGVVLAGFVLVANHEEGYQLREIVFALYVVGFLAHWFITRCFFYQESIFRTAEEKALALFLCLLPLSISLTVLFGGQVKGAASEGFALALLSLYFPVKEACVRYRRGIEFILMVMAGVGLFATIRNLINYQAVLLQATRALEISGSRVVTSDYLLMVCSLFGLVLLLYARRWWSFGLLLGGFSFAFAGLLLTQSRGYWVAFLFGTAVLFVLVDRRYRKRLLLLGAAGLAALLGVGVVFYGDLLLLILRGISDRFVSLLTASTADISLVNRLRETGAVWRHIVQNPVIGYGMGVPYTFYDIVHGSTDTDAFVHNGFISLWYKFGICGLGLVLFFWARIMWRGAQAFFVREASTWIRAAGLAASVSLAAFTLSTLTSNPFFLKDSMLIFGLLLGLAGGAYHRARWAAAEPLNR